MTVTRDNTTRTIPDHIPEALIWDFDIFEHELIKQDPHVAFWELTRGAPDVFFSPLYDGFWVVQRIEDVREVLRDYESFKNYPIGIPAMVGRPRPLLPLEVDPPKHGRYRSALNPMFTPAAIKQREGQVRELTVDLIDEFAAQGHCDFHHTFGHRLPVQMFLTLIGLPLEDTQQMLEWEYRLFRAPTPEEREAAGMEVGMYIGEFLPKKMQNPSDDVLSQLIAWRDEDGQPFSPEELFDMTFMLFIAGLDTVPNALGMSWKYMAENPQWQTQIRDNPGIIPRAAEELLRATSIVNQTRRANKDLTFRGVEMKEDDAIFIAQTLANRDPDEFPDGHEVKLDRKINNHVSFGLGPHRCLGSHLARLELIVALEEWFKKIPEFHITPGETIETYGGHSLGVSHLPLTWEV